MAEYNYACKHAYFTKECRRVLCDLAPTPDFGDHGSIIHSMCAYQPQCPNARACGLSKGWETCFKVQQEREKAARRVKAGTPRKKNTRKKAVDEE